ncbi:hypothetical protein [Paraburkholderia diazotrophica]|uniref:hypothetical protein n=1 Tax=Paraburkholderia diazotrophica TaxID=667676 RepID=UPI0015A59BAD|nr:hypothetical protein [Paraburkholderia diazotrophica]
MSQADFTDGAMPHIRGFELSATAHSVVPLLVRASIFRRKTSGFLTLATRDLARKLMHF